MNHFLSLMEHSAAEIRVLLDLATELKQEYLAGGNEPVLQNRTLAMVFQKPSLRTRVSFEIGMRHLGGHAIMLGPQEIGLGKRESIPDVARVLSGYVDGIMARVFAHRDVVDLAAYATVPVINGLSDAYHPCQAMADLLTIRECVGQLDGVQIAYIGDGNNVAASLLYAAVLTGMHLRIATPEGYELPEEVRAVAEGLQAENAGRVLYTTRPEEAVENADVVYTDTWISMGQDDEAAQRRRDLADYQINRALLAYAHAEAIVMHCLPAHRGEEITDDVMDGSQSVVFQQAENRLHAQKAILVKYMNS